jgi:hypothetical protein
MSLASPHCPQCGRLWWKTSCGEFHTKECARLRQSTTTTPHTTKKQRGFGNSSEAQSKRRSRPNLKTLFKAITIRHRKPDAT